MLVNPVVLLDVQVSRIIQIANLNSPSNAVTRAMNSLALLYFAGYDLPQDYELARAWFLKAAARRSVEAMSNLARMNLYGLGQPHDGRTALFWDLQSGKYSSPKLSQVGEWVESRAKAQNPKAVAVLWKMFAYGIGAPEVKEEANAWYCMAHISGVVKESDGFQFFSSLMPRALQTLQRNGKPKDDEIDFILNKSPTKIVYADPAVIKPNPLGCTRSVTYLIAREGQKPKELCFVINFLHDVKSATSQQLVEISAEAIMSLIPDNSKKT